MPKPKNLECPVSNCLDIFHKHSTLRGHIMQTHNIEIKEESLMFEDEIAFMEWKSEIEDKDNSTYITETGTRPLKSGSLRRYYICHRSLKSKSKLNNETRKRAMKAVGSNKIGKACPSIMIMTVDNMIHIQYFSTHIGHDCEVGRQPISEPVRTIIAAKLAVGVPVENILDEVRGHAESQALRRIDLIQRKDLHNIIRDFKITRDDKCSLPRRSFTKLYSKTECNANQPVQSKEGGNDNEIKSMLLIMLGLAEKSVLDVYNKDILKIILKQGMDVLTEGLIKTEPPTVSDIIPTQNTIPLKRTSSTVLIPENLIKAEPLTK